MIYIDYAVGKDCWNMEALCYGICEQCGCCAKDKKERYENRLRWLQEQLEENDKFNGWDDDPDGRVLQETNVRINHRYFMRKIRYYKRKLKEMEKSNEI